MLYILMQNSSDHPLDGSPDHFPKGVKKLQVFFHFFAVRTCTSAQNSRTKEQNAAMVNTD